MGFWKTRESFQGGIDPRAIPRYPTGCRLPRLPRPYGKANVMEPAQRRGPYWNQADRKLRNVARGERERFILRPSGIEVFWSGKNRPGPDPGLPFAQADGPAKRRALAQPIFELRASKPRFPRG